jgi:hypothetical protein
MSINSHLSTCVGTQSPKYLEMAQGTFPFQLLGLMFSCHIAINYMCVEPSYCIAGDIREGDC